MSSQAEAIESAIDVLRDAMRNAGVGEDFEHTVFREAAGNAGFVDEYLHISAASTAGAEIGPIVDAWAVVVKLCDEFEGDATTFFAKRYGKTP